MHCLLPLFVQLLFSGLLAPYSPCQGTPSVRTEILKQFVAENASKTAPQLEQTLGNMASLFLARLSAWLRLTFACTSPCPRPFNHRKDTCSAPAYLFSSRPSPSSPRQPAGLSSRHTPRSLMCVQTQLCDGVCRSWRGAHSAGDSNPAQSKRGEEGGRTLALPNHMQDEKAQSMILLRSIAFSGRKFKEILCESQSQFSF